MKILSTIFMACVLALFVSSVNAQNIDPPTAPPCATDADCNKDDLYCNGMDYCNGGTCAVLNKNNPCDSDGKKTSCREVVGNYECVECTIDAACTDPTPLCELISGTCVECLVAADCDNGTYCDGEEVCTANVCEAGTPISCTDQVCDDVTDGCVDCVVDGDCAEGVCEGNVCVDCRVDGDCVDDGDPCNGAELCGANVCTPEGNPCDGRCIVTGPDTYSCAECDNDTQCEDSSYCNGQETCNETAGTCEPAEDACGGSTPLCDEDNDHCYECNDDTQCDAGEVCNIDGVCENFIECTIDDNCTDLDDQYCNGGRVCDTATNKCVDGDAPCAQNCDDENNVCVECVSDDNCTDNGDPCDGDEYCNAGDCTSAGNPCGDQICIPSNPSASTPTDDYTCAACDNDADCEDGVFCNGVATCNETSGVCIAGELCGGDTPICDEPNSQCVECLVTGDCPTDDLYCNGAATCSANICGTSAAPCAGQVCDEPNERCVECLTNPDCTPGEPYCTDSLTCVECLEDENCAEGDSCEEGNCESPVNCGLVIKPKAIKVGKVFRTGVKVFNVKGVKGEQGFDAYGDIDFGPLDVSRAYVTKSGALLRVMVIPPFGETAERGIFDVRVGTCEGHITIK